MTTSRRWVFLGALLLAAGLLVAFLLPLQSAPRTAQAAPQHDAIPPGWDTYQVFTGMVDCAAPDLTPLTPHPSGAIFDGDGCDGKCYADADLFVCPYAPGVSYFQVHHYAAASGFMAYALAKGFCGWSNCDQDVYNYTYREDRDCGLAELEVIEYFVVTRTATVIPRFRVHSKGENLGTIACPGEPLADAFVAVTYYAYDPRITPTPTPYTTTPVAITPVIIGTPTFTMPNVFSDTQPATTTLEFGFGEPVCQWIFPGLWINDNLPFMFELVAKIAPGEICAERSQCDTSGFKDVEVCLIPTRLEFWLLGMDISVTFDLVAIALAVRFAVKLLER